MSDQQVSAQSDDAQEKVKTQENQRVEDKPSSEASNVSEGAIPKTQAELDDYVQKKIDAKFDSWKDKRLDSQEKRLDAHDESLTEQKDLLSRIEAKMQANPDLKFEEAKSQAQRDERDEKLDAILAGKVAPGGIDLLSGDKAQELASSWLTENSFTAEESKAILDKIKFDGETFQGEGAVVKSIMSIIRDNQPVSSTTGATVMGNTQAAIRPLHVIEAEYHKVSGMPRQAKLEDGKTAKQRANELVKELEEAEKRAK